MCAVPVTPLQIPGLGSFTKLNKLKLKLQNNKKIRVLIVTNTLILRFFVFYSSLSKDWYPDLCDFRRTPRLDV